MKGEGSPCLSVDAAPLGPHTQERKTSSKPVLSPVPSRSARRPCLPHFLPARGPVRTPSLALPRALKGQEADSSGLVGELNPPLALPTRFLEPLIPASGTKLAEAFIRN